MNGGQKLHHNKRTGGEGCGSEMGEKGRRESKWREKKDVGKGGKRIGRKIKEVE